MEELRTASCPPDATGTKEASESGVWSHCVSEVQLSPAERTTRSTLTYIHVYEGGVPRALMFMFEMKHEARSHFQL